MRSSTSKWIGVVLAAALLAGCDGPHTQLIEALSIVNWYPSGSAPCVPRDTEIWVTFSEALDPQTVTDENIVLSMGSQNVASTVDYAEDNWTIQITPDTELSFGRVYEIALHKQLRGMSGTSFSTEIISAFRTVPQTGCAADAECLVDRDCASSEICSVTSACTTGCIVDADCSGGQSCIAGSCS